MGQLTAQLIDDSGFVSPKAVVSGLRLKAGF
jgi:hypothetical protein